MRQKGRPKSVEKRRTVTIRLSPKARIYLDEIKKKRIEFDLSRYVSEHIITDFNEGGFNKYAKYRIGLLNMQIEELRDQQERIIAKMREHNEKVINSEAIKKTF